MRRQTVLNFLFGAGLAVFLSLASTASAGDERLKSYIEKQHASLLREYSTLLSLPNLASDSPNIRLNAEAVVALFERRGVEARLLEAEGSPPLVFGELRRPGGKRTVIFYAHYDGQPVAPSQWKDDPWKPVLRDGRLEEGLACVAFRLWIS